MKDFSNCPKCNRALLHEEIRYSNKDAWIKSCKYVDHGFWMLVVGEQIINMSIFIDINKRIVATWSIDCSKLTIVYSNTSCKIPYFEPDLSKYDEIIQKCKTYVVFS